MNLDKKFRKSERLHRRKEIQRLFEKGSSFRVSSSRLVWIENALPQDHPVKMAFSVQKRQFKKAVTRNLIKRRLREAYRLNKTTLYQELNKSHKNIVCMFVYSSPHVPVYQETELLIKSMIKRLIKEVTTR